MTTFTLDTAATEREEWLAKRRTGISGTDIAGILGKSPWATPVSVYLDKKGLSAPSPETPVQKRGKILESTVAGIYEAETGLQLIDPGFMRHPEHEWMVGTPDRIALRPGHSPVSWLHGLEIKTVHWSKRDDWGEICSDEVPLYYMLQVAWYLAVTQLPYFDLWAMFSIDDIRPFRIHRDIELEALLIEQAFAFRRDYILADRMPEMDGSEGATAYLSHRFPRNIEPMLEAPEGALEIARRAKEAQERKKQSEFEETEYKNRLKELIGEAEGFTFGAAGKVTWKKEKDSMGTAWEAVAKDLFTALREFTAKADPGTLPLVEPMLDTLTKKHQVITRQGARKLLLSLKEIA